MTTRGSTICQLRYIEQADGTSFFAVIGKTYVCSQSALYKTINKIEKLRKSTLQGDFVVILSNI